MEEMMPGLLLRRRVTYVIKVIKDDTGAHSRLPFSHVLPQK